MPTNKSSFELQILLPSDRPPPGFFEHRKSAEGRGQWQACDDFSHGRRATTHCLWTIQLSHAQFEKVKEQWPFFESFFGGQRQPLTDAQRQYVAHAQRTEESTVRGLQVNVEPIASHTSLTAAYVNLLLAKRRDDGRQWLRACLDAHTQPPQQDVVYPVIDGLLAQLRQDRKNFEGQCALLAPAYETRDAGTMDLDDNAGVQEEPDD